MAGPFPLVVGQGAEVCDQVTGGRFRVLRNSALPEVMMRAAAWKLICEMALTSYWAVVRRNLPLKDTR